MNMGQFLKKSLKVMRENDKRRLLSGNKDETA
jgi:hypothetical protein